MAKKPEHYSLNVVPLGYVDHVNKIYNPWPDLIENGTKDAKGNVPLSVIQADPAIAGNPKTPADERLKHVPLYVMSRRTPDEVEGIAYRNMVVPSMLGYFKESLRHRYRYDPSTGEPNPEHRMVEFYEGAPGVGKTEMAKTIARMRDERGAIVFDCGGKNLDDILFQTVLDQDKSHSLTKAMDDALAEQNAGSRQFNNNALHLLKEQLGEVLIQTDSGLRIDWELLGKPPQTDPNLPQPDANRSVDAALFEKQTAALKQFMENENIKLDQRAGFGLKRVYGPLIEAILQDRELVLDEYTKGVPGTGMQLQIIWELLNGDPNKKTHTVYGGQGLQFTFDRAKIGEMFHVTLTGNDKSDGKGTFSLDQSTRDRLAPVKIRPLTQRDWAHRISQILCGLPIPTLAAMEPKANEHPEAFREELMYRRNQGLPPEQRVLPDSAQGRMITQWQQTMKASEQLATLCYEIERIKNTESDFYKGGGQSAIRSEVLKGERIDFNNRRFSQLLVQSYKPIPASVPIDQSVGFLGKRIKEDKAQPQKKAQLLPRHSGARPEFAMSDIDHLPWFGQRLQQLLLQEIYRITADKPAAQIYLLNIAKKAGLKKNTTQQAQTANSPVMLEDLLKLGAPDIELDDVARTQSILCDYLRACDPHIAGANEQLLPRDAIASAIQSARQQRDTDAASLSPGEHLLLVPNPDPEKMIDARSAQPFGNVLAVESAKLYSQIPGSRGPKAHLPLVGLIAGLSLPDGIGQANLGHLFSKSFSESELNQPPHSIVPTSTQDRAPFDILENSHPSGIAFTSLRCRSKDNAVTVLHVLKNADGKALMIGEGLEQKWVERLQHQGIIYIDRTQEQASIQIKEAFDTVLGTHKDDAQLLSDLGWAFKIRNELHPSSGLTAQTAYSISDMERLLLEPELSLPEDAVRVTPFAHLDDWRTAIEVARAAQTEALVGGRK